MPLSKAPVSMMVHKVGRTVLIDEFDIHRHLLRKQKVFIDTYLFFSKQKTKEYFL